MLYFYTVFVVLHEIRVRVQQHTFVMCCNCRFRDVACRTTYSIGLIMYGVCKRQQKRRVEKNSTGCRIVSCEREKLQTL